MARLPRYQESGLVSGDIPRLDFANLREESQTMASVGNALDRLSQFAFGEAKKEQDRVNKLTAIQVRTQLESEVQKRMAELNVKVETGQLSDFNAIQTEVQALSGLADGLKDLDIDQANGLIGSIRTSGKALLAKSSDILVKNYQAGLQVQIKELNKDYSLTIQTALEVDPSSANFDYVKGLARRHVYSVGVQANSADKAMNDFDAMVNAVERSTMVKYLTSEDFGATESERLAKLDANDAGKFSQLWNAKAEPDRIEIKKAMYQAVIDKSQAKQRDSAALKDSNDRTYVSTYRDYMQTKDPAKKAELAKTLVMSADTVEEIDRVLKAPETGGDALLFSNLREDIERNRITDYRQLQRFVRPGGIDKTQLNQLQTQLYSQQDEGIKAIKGKIREQSGIGAHVGLFDPKEARVVKNAAITERFERFVQQARDENSKLPADKVKPLDYDALFQKALKDYQDTDAKNIVVQQAQAKLNLYVADAKKRGRDVVINQDTNIEDLRRLGIFKDDQLDNIRKQIDIIRNNQTR